MPCVSMFYIAGVHQPSWCAHVLSLSCGPRGRMTKTVLNWEEEVGCGDVQGQETRVVSASMGLQVPPSLKVSQKQLISLLACLGGCPSTVCNEVI